MVLDVRYSVAQLFVILASGMVVSAGSIALCYGLCCLWEWLAARLRWRLPWH